MFDNFTLSILFASFVPGPPPMRSRVRSEAIRILLFLAG